MRRRQNDPRQLELAFEAPRPPSTAPGALDLDGQVRRALTEAIRASGQTRAIIAARMTELAGRSVTANSLNAWTAPTRRAWQFPFSLTVAFEVATETYTLTELHAGLRGCKTLIGEEAVMAEWGRLQRIELDVKARKRALRERMEGR